MACSSSQSPMEWSSSEPPATDTLKEIRAEFVQSVEEEILKQLVDLLLKDGILNPGEKKSFLQKTKTTMDQARDLIDSVIGKGDTAGRAMLDHLHKRDNKLHTKLLT